jgi:hypothetical protein
MDQGLSQPGHDVLVWNGEAWCIHIHHYTQYCVTLGWSLQSIQRDIIGVISCEPSSFDNDDYQ